MSAHGSRVMITPDLPASLKQDHAIGCMQHACWHGRPTRPGRPALNNVAVASVPCRVPVRKPKALGGAGRGPGGRAAVASVPCRAPVRKPKALGSGYGCGTYANLVP